MFIANETSSASSETQASLGGVVRAAREQGGVDVPAGMSSRQLALRAEVSPAQLNRIENDQVAQPRREILVAIARALNRNPVPLLILAGHVTGEDARRELRYLFRHEAELPEEWGAWVRFDLARVRALLADPNASAQDLGTIAADVFRVQETQETLWDDSYELASARGEGAAQLRRLMAVWPTIAAYRERVLEYAEHWAQIADLEYAASVRQLELEADANTAGDDQNGER